MLNVEEGKSTNPQSKASTPKKLPSRKHSKHRFYPYVYQNNNNHFNKNNIKMRKVKKSLELNIKSLVDNKKYKFDQKSTKNINNLQLSLKHSPLRSINSKFTYISTLPNINSINSHNSHNFPYIKTEINNTESTEENKSPRGREIFQDIISCIDNLDLNKSIEEEINKSMVKNQTKDDIFLTEIDKNKENFTDYSRNYSKRIESLQNVYLHDKIQMSTQVTSPRYRETHSLLNYTKKELKQFYSVKQKMLNYNFKNDKFTNFSDTPDDIERRYMEYLHKIEDPKNFINKISSFKMKLNTELARISRGYGKEKSQIKFAENPLLSNFYSVIPKYDKYKNIKIIEDRKSHGYKFKLAPLKGANKFTRLDNFGYQMYYKKGF